MRSKTKPQISPLRYAPPDFLWNLVAFAHFMLLSLTIAVHAAMFSAAWQEIRVRSRLQVCLGIDSAFPTEVRETADPSTARRDRSTSLLMTQRGI